MTAISSRIVGRLFFKRESVPMFSFVPIKYIWFILDWLHLPALIIGTNFSGNLKEAKLTVVLILPVQQVPIVDH